MKFSTLIAVCLLVFSVPVFAADDAFFVRASSGTYFVSGLLKKDGEGVTVKLVHSIERARSKGQALEVFSEKVRAEYPGYSLADSLVTEDAGTPSEHPKSRPEIFI